MREISRRILESARGVKLLQTASVGYDFINMEAANELKIPVANNPGYSTTSVAEHTIMFMLLLLKKALKAHELGTRNMRTMKEIFGIWDSVLELRGKTLGILGLGNIGKEVARLAKAFGPTILYHKRNRLTEEEETRLGVEYCSLQDLLARSDILSIHVPLTEETRNLIGRKEIAQMKTGAILLNLARGEVVDEEALAEAVIEGKLSGVGTDVLIEKRGGDVIEVESPLIGLDNVMITPHLAGPTKEARDRSQKQFTDNILRVLSGYSPLHLVNDVV
jgi:lactate dehydrogenase-like 2-hydroxyacid dehydrogenase